MAELRSETGFLNIQGAPLYYEVAGQGHPLLLIHAGVADSRMWDEQFAVFASQYRVVRFDLRGFGQSMVPPGLFANFEDVSGLLKSLDIQQAHIVAVSFGGEVALDFALVYPEMVTSLVLSAPGVGGQTPPDEVRQFNKEEEELLERGDLDAASELNVRMWVDGPRRTPDQVNAVVRQRVYEMQHHAFTLPIPEKADELSLQPPAITQLADIQVPTLLIVGEYDLPGMHDLVKLLATEMPYARQVVVANAAHMVNMEQPEEFNRLVLAFLNSIDKP